MSILGQGSFAAKRAWHLALLFVLGIEPPIVGVDVQLDVLSTLSTQYLITTLASPGRGVDEGPVNAHHLPAEQMQLLADGNKFLARCLQAPGR